MAAVDTYEVKDGVDQETVDAVRNMDTYKYGWETDIEMEYAPPKGLNTDIVRLISSKNEEPEWMTNWRLEAYERWLQKEEPTWAMVDYPEIDFRTSITTPGRNRWRSSPSRSMMSTPSCWKPTRSSVSH